MPCLSNLVYPFANNNTFHRTFVSSSPSSLLLPHSLFVHLPSPSLIKFVFLIESPRLGFNKGKQRRKYSPSPVKTPSQCVWGPMFRIFENRLDSSALHVNVISVAWRRAPSRFRGSAANRMHSSMNLVCVQNGQVT